MPPLRASMSVEVDVDTGHVRGLPHFLMALFDRSHADRSHVDRAHVDRSRGRAS
jgi:hypothetical protein